MIPTIHHIFDDIPKRLPDEIFERISGTGNVRIERIVSLGHCSAEDFWYDQEQAEYVLLLKGRAVLRFEDSPDVTVLEPGDYVTIPAHVRHRVASTSAEEHTVWLAVHYG